MCNIGKNNQTIFSKNASTVTPINITSKPYDSRLPGNTIYANWTSGTNYHFYLSDGKNYGIGTRFYDGYYSEKCQVPENDTGETIALSDVDIRIRAEIHNRVCNALTPEEEKAIKNEQEKISSGSSGSKLVLVKKQACLSRKGFLFSEDEMVSINTDYYYFSGDLLELSINDIKETPPGTVFYHFYGCTWWQTWSDLWEVYIPWSETKWGSKERLEAEKETEKEAEEASEGHEEEYFKLAKKYGIPYSLVVRCWGDTEMFKNIMPNLRAIVNYSVPVEVKKLSKFDTRSEELTRLGFRLEEKYAIPIAEFILLCIKAKKIVYLD